MSLIDSELQDGLSEMESDQSTDGEAPTFIYAGKTWPCSVGTKKRGNTLEIGGKVVTFDFSLRVRRNVLDTSGATEFSAVTVPKSGNDITQDGTVYTIEFVDAAHGAFYALYLISANA